MTSPRFFMPRSRNSRSRPHISSTVSSGSPPAFKYRGPCKVPCASTTPPSFAKKLVRQAYSGPRPDNAVHVVTIFMTEAGLRGVVALMAIRGGPPISCTYKDKALVDRRVAFHADCSSEGRSWAPAAPAHKAKARQAISRCAVRTPAPTLCHRNKDMKLPPTESTSITNEFPAAAAAKQKIG